MPKSEQKYVYRTTNNADFESTPTVTGTVTEKDKAKVDGKVREFIIVDGDEGLTKVWISKGLEDMYAAVKVGMSVEIHYLRTVPSKTKKGQTFKQFAVKVWQEK